MKRKDPERSRAKRAVWTSEEVILLIDMIKEGKHPSDVTDLFPTKSKQQISSKMGTLKRTKILSNDEPSIKIEEIPDTISDNSEDESAYIKEFMFSQIPKPLNTTMPTSVPQLSLSTDTPMTSTTTPTKQPSNIQTPTKLQQILSVQTPTQNSKLQQILGTQTTNSKLQQILGTQTTNSNLQQILGTQSTNSNLQQILGTQTINSNLQQILGVQTSSNQQIQTPTNTQPQAISSSQAPTNSILQPLLYWTFSNANWWYLVVAEAALVKFTLKILPEGIQVNWFSQPTTGLADVLGLGESETDFYVGPLHGQFVIVAPQTIEHNPLLVQKMPSSVFRVIRVPFVRPTLNEF